MTFTVSVSAAPVDDSDADGSPTPAPDLIGATAPGLVMLEAILRAGTSPKRPACAASVNQH
jgi:hypothetical protein